LTKAPKQLSVEPRSLKQKSVLFVTVLIAIEMIIVTLVYLVYQLIIKHDVFVWINSTNLWTFILGLFLPAVLLLIVNEKFEPIYLQNFQSQPQTTEECYCCSNQFPSNEMKTLHICKQCQIDQKVE